MITLYLRKANGKGDRLQINPDNKVQELIESIKRTFVPSNETNDIEAYFKGDNLNLKKEQTLADCSIVNSSIIHVLLAQTSEKDEREDITVKLVLQEKLLSYSIKAEDTIGTLKHTICQDLDIKYEDDLTLAYLGSELDNSKKAEQYRFPREVFISGNVSVNLANLIHKKTYSSLDKESASEESEGIPKIVRENRISAVNRVKKAESMAVQANVDPSKSKNIFASVQLNRIDEKIEESKNQSQINESQQISQQKEQETEHEHKNVSIQWQKPKMTLQSLSKPWYGSQKIIETESIVDDQEEEPLMECSLELVRTDQLREYVLDCRKENTFQDALTFLAQLQKLPESSIRLLINFQDLTRSGISNRSSKGMIQNCPLSPQIKKQRSSCSFQSKELLKTYQQKHDGMKMAIVDYATRLKKKELSFQFEIFREI